jgi:hypothetical protein
MPDSGILSRLQTASRSAEPDSPNVVLGLRSPYSGWTKCDDAMTVVTAALFPQPWEWNVIVEEYAMNAPICLSRWSTWCAVA